MAIERNNYVPNERTQEVSLLEEQDAPFVETEFEDGSIEFDFSEESVNSLLQEGVVNLFDDHYANIAEEIEETVLNAISSEVKERYDNDKDSRADWLETINSGLKLLGIEVEETDDPFPGACSAHHPMILEAAVKFQAKASNELFNPKGPVKTAIVGTPDEEKEAQANRIRNHMNYQVMEQMEEYFDEAERLLFYLPIVGSGFKKTYYCSILDRPVSQFVPVDEFVVNYYATNLKTASCFTHLIHRSSNDLRKDMVKGLYRELELKSPSNPERGDTDIVIDEITGVRPSTEDSIHAILEQYCYLDLEEDPERDENGIALPYVVSVELETGKVLSIRRNWREEDPNKLKICPFTHYKFVPGLGFYGLGFVHLLGNLQMTLTATMRSLIDSGTFANLQGGFIDKRLRIRSSDGPIAPGEYKEVEAGGIALKDAILPLQFKEPSQTLLMMFQHVEARGQKFADSTEQVVADSTNYGPVGTTMALLEASSKFFSGVHKRLHISQKHEFQILASLNYEYLGESETFDVVGNTFRIYKEDYDGRIDVVPVSDPNVGSQAQKLTIAQAVYTAALQNPQSHDLKAVTKYYYSSIGVDEELIDKFLPPSQEAEPSDPITDIAKAQKGTPIAAFPGQDHDAHVQVKTAFLQDPTTGGNPMMANVIPVIQANIQEHLLMKFSESVQGTTGGDTNEAVVAQAVQKVAQTNQRLAELEAVGPDAARNKLADAELQRVVNESAKLEAEITDKAYARTFDAMKLELDKYKADLQFLGQQMREQNQAQQTHLKEITDLIKESQKIEQAAKQKKVVDKKAE